MEVKLIISADESAIRFAELLGNFAKEGITIESEPKKEKLITVGTEPYSEWTTQEVKELQTAPVDKPEVEVNNIVDTQVYTAEELRAVALQIPKESSKQQEVARILQSACDPGAKPSISNVLPENSYQTMVRLKTLAGIE